MFSIVAAQNIFAAQNITRFSPPVKVIFEDIPHNVAQILKLYFSFVYYARVLSFFQIELHDNDDPWKNYEEIMTPPLIQIKVTPTCQKDRTT